MTTKMKSGRSPTTFASSSTSSRLKLMRCVRRSPRRFRKRPSSFQPWSATPKRKGTTSCTTPMSAESWITSARCAKACSSKPRVSSKLLDAQPSARRHRPERLLALRLWRGRQAGIANRIGRRAEAQRIVEGARQGHRSLGRVEYESLQSGWRIPFRFGDGAPPGGALEKLPMLGRAAAEDCRGAQGPSPARARSTA